MQLSHHVRHYWPNQTSRTKSSVYVCSNICQKKKCFQTQVSKVKCCSSTDYWLILLNLFTKYGFVDLFYWFKNLVETYLIHSLIIYEWIKLIIFFFFFYCYRYFVKLTRRETGSTIVWIIHVILDHLFSWQTMTRLSSQYGHDPFSHSMVWSSH